MNIVSKFKGIISAKILLKFFSVSAIMALVLIVSGSELIFKKSTDFNEKNYGYAVLAEKNNWGILCQAYTLEQKITIGEEDFILEGTLLIGNADEKSYCSTADFVLRLKLYPTKANSIIVSNLPELRGRLLVTGNDRSSKIAIVGLRAPDSSSVKCNFVSSNNYFNAFYTMLIASSSDLNVNFSVETLNFDVASIKSETNYSILELAEQSSRVGIVAFQSNIKQTLVEDEMQNDTVSQYLTLPLTLKFID